jgi:hypothetical protein
MDVIYRVIQEERSTCCDVMVSVIVRKVGMNVSDQSQWPRCLNRGPAAARLFGNAGSNSVEGMDVNLVTDVCC